MISRGRAAASPSLPLPLPDRPHLVLIGFMGSGKSTVGTLLAARLRRSFVDTDARIVAAADGRTIPAIFAEEGEQGFRDRESRTIADVCAASQPLVIATGGGAILRTENVDRLRASGTVVWLTADVESVLLRAGRDRNRPLLAGPGGEQETRTRILTLLAERGPCYQAAADLVVDTSGRTPDHIVREIVRKIERGGRPRPPRAAAGAAEARR